MTLGTDIRTAFLQNQMVLKEVRLGPMNEWEIISLLVLPCINGSRRHQEAKKNKFKNSAWCLGMSKLGTG